MKKENNKTIAIIFAGGTGQRMNTKTRPKQFLELHGKPILVYTIEEFEKHELINGIILVVLNDWIEYCRRLIEKYQLSKVEAIIPGGKTAQESSYLGLKKAEELYGGDAVVLIHDGVRPLIDGETITKDIMCVYEHGAAITVSPAIETITIKGVGGCVGQIIERSKCEMARAPQCFILKEILEAHNKANIDGKAFIDSASLMQHYGHDLYTIEGPSENIKITTPSDFYIFRAIVDARENSQIFGL